LMTKEQLGRTESGISSPICPSLAPVFVKRAQAGIKDS
jgi:hypothetical protein